MKGSSLGRFARDAAAAFAFLATSAGAYWAASALGIKWAFWLLFAPSILYALLRPRLKRVHEWLVRRREWIENGKKYSVLLQAAATLQDQKTDLESRLEAANARLGDAFDEGVLAGRKRAIGELAAASFLGLLKPTFMEAQGTSLRFGAEVNDAYAFPVVGSVWTLRRRSSGSKVARLLVESVQDGLIVLSVESAWDTDYVKSLTDRARSTDNVGRSLEIARREFTDPFELTLED